jgi:hypothetical protein
MTLSQNMVGISEKCRKNKRRKRRGRPKLKPGERMTVRREVGLRPKEARLLDSLAKEAGKTFNAWAREILLSAAGQ